MINDARLAAGKTPVGFINPTVRFVGCYKLVGVLYFLVDIYPVFLKTLQ